jgi:hypothetical protein
VTDFQPQRVIAGVLPHIMLNQLLEFISKAFTKALKVLEFFEPMHEEDNVGRKVMGGTYR